MARFAAPLVASQYCCARGGPLDFAGPQRESGSRSRIKVVSMFLRVACSWRVRRMQHRDTGAGAGRSPAGGGRRQGCWQAWRCLPSCEGDASLQMNPHPRAKANAPVTRPVSDSLARPLELGSSIDAH